MAARKPASLFARAPGAAGWKTRMASAAAFADLSATRQTLDMWTGRLDQQLRVRRRAGRSGNLRASRARHPHRAAALAVAVRRPAGRGSQVPRRGAQAESGSGGLGASRGALPRRKWRAVPADSRSRASIDDTRYSVTRRLRSRARHRDAGAARVSASPRPAPRSSRCWSSSPQARRPRPLPDAEAARDAVAEVVGRLLDERRRGGFHRQQRSARARARAAHRAVAVPHRGQLRGQRCRRRKRGCSPTAGTASSISRCTPGMRRISRCGAGPSCSSAACPGISRISRKRKARAKANGVRGAWWPKMVGPEGRESPSTVNPFIMWQQPHPIYLAETLWIKRASDTRDAGEIQRAGVRDRRPARELAVLRQEGASATSSGRR